MRKRIIKGIAAALCLAVLAPAAAVTMPGAGIVSEATGSGAAADDKKTDAELLKEAKDGAEKILRDYQRLIDPNGKKATKLNSIITKAVIQIQSMETAEGVNDYINKTKTAMDKVVNPPSDSGSDNKDDNNDDDDPVPANADHFLMVGGSWVTPVANAGQAVSIVLPVVNMGKTEVTKAVVTPVLSTESTEWPFEITNSNYTQTIDNLPGTDTGMSDMDRRRELTWNLMTRSDVGSGYQKISFSVRYFASDGSSQSTTLDTYVQLNGTAGVGADGQASVPRVIVTGFETSPADVHAGESFMLTLHLKNTSTATSVNNMIFEIVAAVEGKDEDTTYAAFLPTAGSSTIFVDRIEKNGTRDIQIEMEAKADLTQKPYAVDVNMSYEDEHVNAYTNKTSVSIPVKQEARVDISEPEVMPQSIEVGSESNIMFSIYNMGKTKLYNVQVKTQSDTVSGGDAFVGNLDSGATGSVDIYVTGQQATMDEGLIKLLISYEDETGASTVIEKEVSLFVTESMMMDDPMMDGSMMDDPMIDGEQGGKVKYIAAIVGVLAVAAIIGVTIFLKKKKKKAQLSLEEDLLDLNDDDLGGDE
ncbi:MAG TPA: hypothetical protein DD414_10240 [Lachnospiraceae bacterium]|nr:hypothetical protein [Lachnospiraceae bacterium]